MPEEAKELVLRALRMVIDDREAKELVLGS
jgi:hypothetical protein